MTTKIKYANLIIQQPIKDSLTTDELKQAIIYTGLRCHLRKKGVKSRYHPLEVLAIHLGAKENPRAIKSVLFNLYGVDFVKGWADAFHGMRLTSKLALKKKKESTRYALGFTQGMSCRQELKDTNYIERDI